MVVRSLHLSSLTCNRGTHFKQQHIYSTMKTLLRCMALQPPRFQEVAERLASNQTPCPLSPFKLAPGVTTTNALVAAELLSYMRGVRATPEARTPKRIESSDRYKNRRTMLQLRDTHYTSSGFLLHLRVVHGNFVEASSSAEAVPESLPSDGRRLIVMKALDWINSILVYEIKVEKGRSECRRVEARESRLQQKASAGCEGGKKTEAQSLQAKRHCISVADTGVKGFRFSMVRMRAAEEVLRNLDENGHVV